MQVVGLGHYSRTGKDTFANSLVASLREMNPKLRVKKIPFAWKLKDICHQLYAWAGLKAAEFYETPEGEKLRNVVLPAIGKTPVQIWIDMGTPAVRDHVYQNTWIDYLMESDLNVDVLIVPDVRFYNEVAAMKQRNAPLIKVVRPGYGPRESIADRALMCYRDWDYVIGTSGKMSELHHWASQFACWIHGSVLPVQSDLERAQAYEIERIKPWVRDHEWLQSGWKLEGNRLRYLTATAA
jgi:hypothetical protein